MTNRSAGAWKLPQPTDIKKEDEYNFFNYNTNDHRHICEIREVLENENKSEVIFSFNPHILPNFRGMMSTIYCDLSDNVNHNAIIKCFEN